MASTGIDDLAIDGATIHILARLSQAAEVNQTIEELSSLIELAYDLIVRERRM